MNILDMLKASCTLVNLDEVVTVQPQKCMSFSQLISVYEQDMTITQSFKDCTALCLAVHLAVKLEGDPLWLYLVGAPSSGKSTLCELIAADEMNTRPLSKFTGLVSGMTKGRHLIPMIQNRCVVIKDGTLLLESSQQQLANVYGELRDIFDGSLEAHYRNGVSASFSNISFGMIVGITERIYSLNMAALGERFLHCRLETTRDVEIARNAHAVDSIMSGISRSVAEGAEADSRSFPKQRAYTAGFLNHLHTKVATEDLIRPKYEEEDKLLIQSLADVIACSRAQAPRSTKQDEILYDCRPEASTRVVKQLTRLAYCLCYVLGVDRFTHDIRRLLTKVAMDTAFSKQYTIIQAVALSASGLTKSVIAEKTRMPLETITRRIDDLIHLKIFDPDRDARPAKRGRAISVLQCTDWVQDSFRRVAKYNGSSVQNGTHSKTRTKLSSLLRSRKTN